MKEVVVFHPGSRMLRAKYLFTGDPLEVSRAVPRCPVVSRGPSAVLESLEDILVQLLQNDAAPALTEWTEREEDEEEEVEDLLPVLKPKVELTQKLIQELNNGQLEQVSGIKDHKVKRFNGIKSKNQRCDGAVSRIMTSGGLQLKALVEPGEEDGPALEKLGGAVLGLGSSTENDLHYVR